MTQKNLPKSESLSPTQASRRAWAVVILSAIGLIASIFLSYHYYQVRSGLAGFRSFCNLGGSMNCDAVAASAHAELFAGIPLSSFAAGWYVATAAVALFALNAFWRREAVRALFLMTAFSSAMSLYYLFVMASWLKTYCLYCLAVDAVHFLSLGVVLSFKPEGTGVHKPDFGKWKTFVGIAVACVVFGVALLKGIESAAGPGTENLSDVANSVLASPVLSVKSGPEFPSLGAKDAPITIVEFSDFQCPFCRIGAYTINTVMNRYPGKVRVVFRPFPLDPSCNRFIEHSMHPVACETAKLALCAEKQGKFQALYESFFENQDKLAPGKPEELAKAEGLNLDQLKGCAASPEIGSLIASGIDEGKDLGVQSTPTFFINGHKVEGAYPLPVWTGVIDRILGSSESASKP